MAIINFGRLSVHLATIDMFACELTRLHDMNLAVRSSCTQSCQLSSTFRIQSGVGVCQTTNLALTVILILLRQYAECLETAERFDRAREVLQTLNSFIPGLAQVKNLGCFCTTEGWKGFVNVSLNVCKYAGCVRAC